MASSSHEKSHLDAAEEPPLEDVPDYDDLIESALDSLDVYQARRADMNMHLKKAFFNLAQAKLALGPARVSPASYHHGRIEPLLTVDIIPSEDGSFTYSLIEAKPAKKPDTQATSKGKERARGGVVDLRYDASTSAVKLDDPSNEKVGGSKVRRRVQNMFRKDKNTASQSEKLPFEDDALLEQPQNSEATSTESLGLQTKDPAGKDWPADEQDAPPTYSDSVNEYLLDPMQQFSAFPPVTLRKAQTEFKQSLRLATTLLSEQQRFSGMSVAANGMARSTENGWKA